MEEIQRNRRWHLQQLIRTSGGTNEAARITGIAKSYITAIAGPNPTRHIGNKLAAQIESAFELEPGALDRPPPEESKTDDPLRALLNTIYDHASAEERILIVRVAMTIANARYRHRFPPYDSWASDAAIDDAFTAMIKKLAEKQK